MRRSACTRCRSKKLKCDGGQPCHHCQRTNSECVSRETRQTRTLPAIQPAVAVAGRHDNLLRPIDHASTESPALLGERNILDLSKDLIASEGTDHGGRPPYAIPGNAICAPPSLQYVWRTDLPYAVPTDIVNLLIDHYFLSVNWFMLVVDESSFRRRVADLLASEHARTTEKNFIHLVCLIWGLGAHYLWTNPDTQIDPQLLEYLRLRSIQYTEANLLAIASQPDLETVQIGILLGSYHLLNGLPNVGFAILGSTIKSAQLIGLHRSVPNSHQSAWGRDICAKVWWALEIFEKYSAILFGRPCGIDDSDCDVPEILDSEDTVTPLTYHKVKCRLYRIMGPFLGRRKQTHEDVSTLNRRLLIWYKDVPQDLKYNEDGSRATSQPPVIQMQALALQLAYDNLHIVLHKQTVFPRGYTKQQVVGHASTKQLLDSALRTSRITRCPAIDTMCRSSHAAMHVAICVFSAGIVLCALHQTLEDTAECTKALEGIDLIISFLEAFPTRSYPLTSQALQILAPLQRKCHETSYRASADLEQATNEQVGNDIVDAILQSGTWGGHDLASMVDSNGNNAGSAAGLLDFATSSTLDGVAQSWLWSDLYNEHIG